MQRIACLLADDVHAGAVVTGESLGQVASQTLENLTLIEEAGRLPVLRPLIGFDKHETIALARRIGTFDLSIENEPDCCTVFQPERPILRGRLEVCRDAESALDVDGLTAAAFAARRTVDIDL
jgi:thiamine biosynthesis protein ThiI